jgi:hypothetical protein
MAKADNNPQPKPSSGNPAGKVPIGGEGTGPSPRGLAPIPGETTRVVHGSDGRVRGEGSRPLSKGDSGRNSKD